MDSIANNGYNGKYLAIFQLHYSRILTMVEGVKEEFADGFQLKDIPNVVATCAPVGLGLYRQIAPLCKTEAEAEDFLKEMVKFVYFEVVSHLNVNWLVSQLIRWVLLNYAAKKIARYVKIAFDWVLDREADAEKYLKGLPPGVKDLVELVYNAIR